MENSTTDKHKYTNHLIHESSPYLLSHAHNPVEWYPWGERALAKARELDRPIFLSIGYASCHWCHVMERESFENEEIADLMNKNFVSIKVDREQRPDLDHIYMAFTTAMTGSGGWPMSVFLTPELKPFFAGTYFPPEDHFGRPGFKKVLAEIASAYAENREQIVTSSHDIFGTVAAYLKHSLSETKLTREVTGRAASGLMRGFDSAYGGFGNEPKFPHSQELSLFLRFGRETGDLSYLQAAEKSLTAMANGGIGDQLGGGFARYSVDRRWIVPHFEKMLYDNALLVNVYVEAWQITKSDLYKDTVATTLDFILHEMTDSSGGFYSALDADSEGEEGKFYIWTADEIQEVLGEDAHPFMEYYNVSDEGNFEGNNILHVNEHSRRIRESSDIKDFDGYLVRCRGKLMEVRSKRVRPDTDDKILTSWNGLALSAFCKGFQITGDRRYLQAATRNAGFVRETMFGDGKLTHAYRDGVHSEGQFLEDYAYYVRGLLDLYESDESPDRMQWLTFARTLADSAMELFLDDRGTFYLREDGLDDLIVRPKEESDSATPAPGSYMIMDLLKLNRLTGDRKYLMAGERALKAISGLLEQQPQSMTSALFALDYYLSGKIEIVIVGKGETRRQMLESLYSQYMPNKVVAVSDDGSDDLPLFEGREPKDDMVHAYVCENSTCKMPATTVHEFEHRLGELR